MNVLCAALVSYTRFSLLPWCLLDLYKRSTEYHNTWGRAVSSYGLLLSVHQFGQVVGNALASTTKEGDKYSTRTYRNGELEYPGKIVITSAIPALSFLILVVSYICVCFVNRYVVLLLVFFLHGSSGALLLTYTYSDSSNNGFGLQRDSLSSMIIPKKSKDSERSNNTKRTILCFTFSTLVGGYLYESNPTVHFPKFYLFMTFGVCYALVMGYCLFISTIIDQGRKWQRYIYIYLRRLNLIPQLILFFV